MLHILLLQVLMMNVHTRPLSDPGLNIVTTVTTDLTIDSFNIISYLQYSVYSLFVVCKLPSDSNSGQDYLINRRTISFYIPDCFGLFTGVLIRCFCLLYTLLQIFFHMLCILFCISDRFSFCRSKSRQIRSE